MQSPFIGFDESRYLTLNEDVADGVQKEYIASGWDHYITYGFHEGRPGVSPETQQAMQAVMRDCPPAFIPPDELRKRVHGDENPETFENIGRIVALNIHAAIHSALSLGAHSRILDFGCGCGRVIRYFQPLSHDAHFSGTDIDPHAIAWCREHLASFGEFVTNEFSPPLPFDDASFDFIYGISVFTHLPESMQWSWLEELQRVTRPGGYLLLTAHGAALLETGPEDARQQLQERGFYYAVGDGTEGLPDFYQTSFHTRDYIEREWGRFFEIKKIVKRGIANYQDLILCRKR